MSRTGRWALGLWVMGFSSVALADEGPTVVQHVDVYKEAGRFGGWPANNGIWNWGDEIVVGFTLGYHKEKSGHTIDPDKPSGPMQARSTDGGESWSIETPTFVDQSGKERKPETLKEPVDFSQPNFAARLRSGGISYSSDRCRSWQGPYSLPSFGRPGLLARTDYLVEGPKRMTAFVAAEKDGGGEGQPLCMRTTDGGMNWSLVGWIGDQPPASYGYAIMSATVRVGKVGYLSMIRRGGVFDGRKSWWIEAFLSHDDGRSWYMLESPRIDNVGNPATLTRLRDGRLALVYGWRLPPYGIRGRLSSDEGQTWSDEFILQDDGRTWDLGYPRTVERADGSLVTVYYFNDASGVERHIKATIWHPGTSATEQADAKNTVQ